MLLVDYIGSFLEHHGSPEDRESIEFVFVENSQDDRTEIHARKLRTCGFNSKVEYMENKGFGAGCNVGARAASGDILIFANPDIRFLSNLLEAEEDFRQHYWGTVRQLNDDNRVYAFDLLPDFRNFLTEVLRVHHFIHALRPLRRFAYPIGSFMFVDKDLFEKSGGFDERFFLYFEEAELSCRLLRLVGPATYLEKISIWHKGLGTQPSSTFALKEDASGFATYCEVTGQEWLITRRIQTMRLLSPMSKTASMRAQMIHAAWQERVAAREME
jgi:hypothetical protein